MSRTPQFPEPTTVTPQPRERRGTLPSPRALLLLVLGMLIAFALRIYDLSGESIWDVEATSIFIARHPWGEIAFLPRIHPPLYFYLLHIWMGIVGDSEFALRMLSLLTSIPLVAFLYRLGTSLLSPRAGMWSMVLGIISPFLIFYAQEMRMYSLIMLLTALAAYALWQSKKHSRLHYWIILAVALTLGLYTHYSFFFFLLAANLWMIFMALRGPLVGNRKIWVLWIAAQGLALGVFVLYLPVLISQLNIPRETITVPLDLASINFLTWMRMLFGPSLGPELVQGFSILILILIALSLGAYLRRRSRSGIPDSGIGLVVFWVLVPLLGFWLAVKAQSLWPPDPRYVAIITPALLIFLAWVIVSLESRYRWAGLLVGLELMALTGSGTMAYLWPGYTVRPDARSVAHYLTMGATEKDIILSLENPLPLEYYYSGAAPLAEINVQPTSVAEDLARLTAGRDRIYLVSWWTVRDPWGLAPFLLERESMHAAQPDFAGYWMGEYQLRENPNFALILEYPPAEADFGGVITIQGWAYGVGLAGDESGNNLGVMAGDTIALAIKWELQGTITSDYRASLQLIDPAGRAIAQADALLRNEAGLLSSRWQVRDAGWTVHRLEIPPGTPPGTYSLEVGVYARASGEALAPALLLTPLTVETAP